MAEEKQTPQTEQVNDTLSTDDVSMLREVLLDSHSRGIEPVSVYRQADFEAGDF